MNKIVHWLLLSLINASWLLVAQAEVCSEAVIALPARKMGDKFNGIRRNQLLSVDTGFFDVQFNRLANDRDELTFPGVPDRWYEVKLLRLKKDGEEVVDWNQARLNVCVRCEKTENSLSADQRQVGCPVANALDWLGMRSPVLRNGNYTAEVKVTLNADNCTSTPGGVCVMSGGSGGAVGQGEGAVRGERSEPGGGDERRLTYRAAAEVEAEIAARGSFGHRNEEILEMFREYLSSESLVAAAYAQLEIRMIRRIADEMTGAINKEEKLLGVAQNMTEVLRDFGVSATFGIVPGGFYIQPVTSNQ